MNGFGIYYWKDAGMYRGEWENNVPQGCGVWRQPGLRGQQRSEQGQFVGNNFLGPGLACPVESAEYAAEEADEAAQRARRFQ